MRALGILFAIFLVVSRAGADTADDAPWRWMAGIEPIGLAVLTPSIGAVGGRRFAEDHVLEASHVRGMIPLVVLEVYSRVTALRVKSFWTETFYTNVGLGLRTMGARFSVRSLTGVGALDAGVEATSVVGDLAIGNQWRVGSVTIGCDWLGWMPHLALVELRRYHPGDQADAGDQARQMSRYEGLVKRGTPQFLRLTVGYFW